MKIIIKSVLDDSEIILNKNLVKVWYSPPLQKLLATTEGGAILVLGVIGDSIFLSAYTNNKYHVNFLDLYLIN